LSIGKKTLDIIHILAEIKIEILLNKSLHKNNTILIRYLNY